MITAEVSRRWEQLENGLEEAAPPRDRLQNCREIGLVSITIAEQILLDLVQREFLRYYKVLVLGRFDFSGVTLMGWSRATVGWIGVVLTTVGFLQLQAAPLPEPHPEGLRPQTPPHAQTSTGSALPDVRALLDRYCVTCHNERLRTAGLALDEMDLAQVGDGAQVWEKVVRKLRTGMMPPAGRPRPDQAVLHAFVSSLETALDRAAAAKPNPGPPAVHRLNRFEYGNAIRDLLGLEVDTRTLLPSDEEGHGFDNMADALSVSPTLFERYIVAARRISQLALGDPAIRPVFETYAGALDQNERTSDDLPFGSRGGMAIRHYFPLDGEYVIRVRLQRQIYRYIRGLGQPHQLDVRLDGERLKVFTVGRHWEKGQRPPISYAGNTIASPAWEEYAQHADDHLEVRTAVKAGRRIIGISFDRRPALPEGALQPGVNRSTYSYGNDDMQDGNPAVSTVMVGGPFDALGAGETPSRQKILVCRPAGSSAAEEQRCAKTILSTLARRAYRRPVNEEDVQTLLKFYEVGRREGSFETGIQAALERLLADPQFLFRVSRPPVGVTSAAYRVSDLELASRLSFFLWSSIPDDELLDLATLGKLTEPTVLERQVRRMLADARSNALVSSFAGQWLQLRNLRNVAPDTATFPAFDENLRHAMQRETELFFESQLREDRSVVDLLRADYTFLNERLARHYGRPDVYGIQFRRMTVDDDRRHGLLGHASLLTVTSYATRTSPVLRGKWVLDTLLGSPPPPPPPNVSTLPDDGRAEGQPPASVRERLEQHRTNPVCASCHDVIDPLGFALENFDAVGRWRTTNEAATEFETGVPIDASSALSDGTKLEGPAGLRRLLLSRQEQFVSTVAEKLLTYALGRGVEYYDMRTVRQIVREAADRDYRWSSLILGIVNSTPFQMGRSQS